MVHALGISVGFFADFVVSKIGTILACEEYKGREEEKIKINLLFISQSRNLNIFSSKISWCALFLGEDKHKSDTIHSGLGDTTHTTPIMKKKKKKDSQSQSTSVKNHNHPPHHHHNPNHHNKTSL